MSPSLWSYNTFLAPQSQPRPNDIVKKSRFLFSLCVSVLSHLSEHFARGGCEWEAVSSFLQSSDLRTRRHTSKQKEMHSVTNGSRQGQLLTGRGLSLTCGTWLSSPYICMFYNQKLRTTVFILNFNNKNSCVRLYRGQALGRKTCFSFLALKKWCANG